MNFNQNIKKAATALVVSIPAVVIPVMCNFPSMSESEYCYKHRPYIEPSNMDELFPNHLSNTHRYGVISSLTTISNTSGTASEYSPYYVYSGNYVPGN